VAGLGLRLGATVRKSLLPTVVMKSVVTSTMFFLAQAPPVSSWWRYPQAPVVQNATESSPAERRCEHGPAAVRPRRPPPPQLQ